MSNYILVIALSLVVGITTRAMVQPIKNYSAFITLKNHTGAPLEFRGVSYFLENSGSPSLYTYSNIVENAEKYTACFGQEFWEPRSVIPGLQTPEIRAAIITKFNIYLFAFKDTELLLERTLPRLAVAHSLAYSTYQRQGSARKEEASRTTVLDFIATFNNDETITIAPHL